MSPGLRIVLRHHTISGLVLSKLQLLCSGWARKNCQDMLNTATSLEVEAEHGLQGLPGADLLAVVWWDEG